MKKLFFLLILLSCSVFVNAQIQASHNLLGTGTYHEFGKALSMPNSHTIAVGAPGNTSKGNVQVFSLISNNWIQKGSDIVGTNNNEQSGRAVSMPDENTIAIGSPYYTGSSTNSGKVTIYTWSGSTWIQKGSIIGGAGYNYRFGSSINMPDANTIAIGATGAVYGQTKGKVQIYFWNGSSWVQKGADIDGEADSDNSGYSISMPDANTLAIGAPYNDGNGSNSGHVRIYSWSGSHWFRKGADINGEMPNDNSGYSVSMPDANTVAIGAPYNDDNGNNSGHVRIYSWSGGSWLQRGGDITGVALGDNFGFSVSMLDENHISIGAPQSDINGSGSGSVHIYSWDGFNWLSFINMYGAASQDQLGSSAIMPDIYTIAVGAPQSDQNGTASGSVQFYKIPFINSVGCLDCLIQNPGDAIIRNNDTVYVVDRPMLDSLVSIGYDLSKVCVSHVTDLSKVFSGISTFNDDIRSWDVSNVIDMDSMFYGCSSFNRNIGNWDVSNVLDMKYMFNNASAFNQDISGWNVSNVYDMEGMFGSATSFSQQLNNWDVSGVQNMKLMFYGATSFNSPISDWDVSNVNSMESMFLFATSFNRPIWNWKVNNVSNMTNMFYYASSFNQDISSWCVSNIGSEPAGFAASSALTSNNKPSWGTCREAEINTNGCLECDQFAVGEWLSHEGDSVLVVNRIMLDSLISYTTYDLEYVCLSKVDNLDSLFVGKTIHGDISAWDVSNVTSMEWTFANQSTFNQEIGNWDISNVESLSHVFINAPSFNHDIGNWNTESVTNMDAAFFFANSFNQDISGWDVSNVTSMNSMFLQAGAFDQDLKPWCMSNIPTAPYDFALNSGLQANNYPRWGVCEAVPGVFISSTGCIECDSLNVGDFFVLDGDSIEVVDRTRLLALVAAQGDLTKVCVSHVQNMKNIFRGAKWFNQDITKWDMSNVTNTVNMFFNAETFNQDLSTWDVSSVTNMTGMFFRADSFNQNLNVWDVSQVTGMSRMFGEAASFNGKIDQWDVSGVNRMTEMFKDATSFNQDLSSWCVSNFEYNAPNNFALNSPLLPVHYPIWGNCPTPYGDNVLALATGAFIDSSGCVDCSALNVGDYFTLGGDTMLVVDRPMLDSLVILRRDLSKVCVSHITDMKDALRGLRWFNTDISSWDVSNVTDMTNMFFKSKIFNQEIGNWNVSSVTNMNRMFQKAESFNGDLSDWDVSNVTKMNATFFGANTFNQDIGDWDVGNVTVADAMFRNAGAFSQDLSMWCVTNIATQPNLFDWNAGLTSSQLPVWGTCPTPPPYQILPNGCVACDSLSVGDQFVINGKTYTVANRAMIETRLNQSTSPDLTDLCVTHVTNMDYLLYNRTNSNPNISNWDVRNVKKTKWMFRNARAFNNNIGNWDVSGFTDMSYMFYGAHDFNQNIGNWDVSNVTDMSYMFAGGYVGSYSGSSYNWSNYYVDDMLKFNKSLNNWDVSSVVNMSHMFDGARYFNSPIGNWDVSNVTDMSYMFYQTGAFNQDIGNWDVSSVTNMESMFEGYGNSSAYTYKSPNIPFNQDIENWDVSSVINMRRMFANATAFNQNLNNWDVSNVANFQGMFKGYTNQNNSSYSSFKMVYNQNMDNWNVSSGDNFSNMFEYAVDFNKDIGDWNVSNATNMSNMFNYALNFNQDIGEWDVSNVSIMSYMFNQANVFFQDLSNWCVPLILSEPNQFHYSANGTLSLALKPIWGTCPVASIAAPDQTDWNTNSTIEGQGNALNLSDGNGISIYPNPTTGIINLDPLPEGTYRLYNEIGRLMDQGTIQPRFDLSNFDNGIYMLLLQTENESKYFKVIKQ